MEVKDPKGEGNTAQVPLPHKHTLRGNHKRGFLSIVTILYPDNSRTGVEKK